MKLLSIAATASFLILSNSLSAAFSGGFELGAPVSEQVQTSGSASFGNWQATTSISNTASTTVDTMGAPNQLVLTAAGEMDADFVSIAELTFASGTFSSDMTVSFNVSLSGSGDWAAHFNYGGENQILSTGTESFSFEVSAGSTLEFVLRATGLGTTSLEGGPGDPGSGDPGTGVEGYPSDVSITVSNFVATAAVPEPSTYGILVGGLVLAGAMVLRRRRS